MVETCFDIIGHANQVILIFADGKAIINLHGIYHLVSQSTPSTKRIRQL